MRLVTVTSIATVAVAVAALVFALWPVVADAPWENDPELRQEILDLQIDMSIFEAEANRPASESEVCESTLNLIFHLSEHDTSLGPEATLLLIKTAIENGCLADAK